MSEAFKAKNFSMKEEAMLIDIESGKEITYVPRRKTFDLLKKRLSPQEIDKIVVHINELIENAGGKIVTAGWLPGSDWSGTRS